MVGLDHLSKTVQIFATVEGSPTQPDGTLLEIALYAGLRLALYASGGPGDGTVDDGGGLGSAVVIHPLDPEDAPTIDRLRAAVRAQKGVRWRIEARKPYDALLESVSAPVDVTFEPGTVGGVPGVWVYPASSRPDQAILHFHGGWFHAGSATAYRHLVGHIAARAAKAFVPDYRLAPEHPFPAAVDDALATYRGLDDRGIRRIAVTGDSAGGNLALVLASCVSANEVPAEAILAGVAALSPVTDSMRGSTCGSACPMDLSPASEP